MLNLEEKHKKMLYPEVRVRSGKALGSGTILYSAPVPEDDGRHETYVLTNEHVVDDLIEIKDQWDSVLRREVKRDILGTPVIETFEYDYWSRVIGGTTYEASIVAYDKREDLALLKVRTPRAFEHVATMYPRDKVESLTAFMSVVTVGCGMGNKPVITFGYISGFGYEIDGRDFIQASAASYMGNCLPGSALISMASNGIKQIKDIEPGDRVWAMGRTGLAKQTVLELVEAGEKEVFELKTRGRTLRASANHPVLKAVARKDWQGRKTWLAEWVELQSVRAGDYVAVMDGLPSREKGQMCFQDYIIQGRDECSFMRLLGFYLGDGWMRHEDGYRYEITLACYDRKLFERYSRILADLFGLEPCRHCAPDQLQVNSKELVETIEALGFTGKAIEKTIPNWLFTMAREYQEEFLAGYLDADGYVNKGGTWVFEANNTELISRLRMLCIHMGYRVSNLYVRMREPKIVDGRECVPNAPSARFQVYPAAVKQSSMIPTKGDQTALPPDVGWHSVSSVESVGTEMTYDIKLRNHHCFFSDGVLVHNSGGATFLEETGQFVGVPARITVAQFGFSADVVSHIGFIIPVWRAYQFLEDQVFQFVYDSEYTSLQCKELRAEKRDQDQQRILREEER